jgi:glucokinase
MLDRIVTTFDIGGTNMRGAIISTSEEKWSLLDQIHRPTPNYLLNSSTPIKKRVEELLDFITDYTNHAYRHFGSQLLVVAIPGPVDVNGVVLALPTMWGSDSNEMFPLDLLGMLKARLPKIKVSVINDVTAAGYRFVSIGENFAIFTLGSGVGLKVFIDGRPQVGSFGRGGELTHMVFDSSLDAALCDCGGRGHLGALVSGRAWQRIQTLAKGHDNVANLHVFVEPLARAIAMLHYSLGIECFFLAGGLADGLGEPLRLATVNRLPEQGWSVGQNWNSMLKLAPNDDLNALIGAALVKL